MQERAKVIYFIAATVLLIGIAILVWANQTGKISIWGAGVSTDETATTVNIGWTGVIANNQILCPNSLVTGIRKVMQLPGTFDSAACSNVLISGAATQVSTVILKDMSVGQTIYCDLNSYAWITGFGFRSDGIASGVYCGAVTGSGKNLARGSTTTVALGSECPASYAAYGVGPNTLYCAKTVYPVSNNSTPTPTNSGKPTATISASPAQVTVGDNFTVTYSSNGATLIMLAADCNSIVSSNPQVSCNQSAAPWTIASAPANGTITFKAKSNISQYIFSIRAANSAGQADADARVNVASSGSTDQYTFTMTKNYCGTTGQISEFTTNVPSNLYNTICVRNSYNNIGVCQGENKQSYSISWKQFDDGRFDRFYFDLWYANSFSDQNIKWATPVASTGATVATIDLTGLLPTNPTHGGLLIPKITCATPAPTDTQAPTSPSNLTAETSGSNQIVLSWTASTDNVGVVGYEIYNADTNQLINTTNTPNYTVTGSVCDTEYKFYVKAYDAAGNKSANSNTVSYNSISCLAADTVAPSTPSNVIASSTTCHQIGLSWQASLDITGDSTYDLNHIGMVATGYDIYNANDNKLITTTNNNFYTFDGLNENSNYSYYVKAHDAAGNSSAKSDNASLKTQVCSSNQPKTTDTSSSSNITKLVSTGNKLWLNILVALLISALVSFFLFRKPKNQ
jgi:chitodextrinase